MNAKIVLCIPIFLLPQRVAFFVTFLNALSVLEVHQAMSDGQ